MADHNTLFSPLTIKGVTLRNRVVAPPMVQVRSIISKEGIGWYRRLAAGGAGLVIVEATGVSHFGTDWSVQDLRPLVEAIHDEGAAAAIQLFPVPFGQKADLNALTTQQIQEIIEQYGRAAAMCREAGFDGVDPHGAHGYMLNQMFMPDVNLRTDRYGGSLENRGRMGIEIVRRMRQAVGSRMLILYRHSPEGKQYTMDESLTFADWLIAAGLDVLDISPARKEIVADLSLPFKRRFDVPVIAVQGMEDPAAAEEALREGRCDLVAVGRQLIADAAWPKKVQTAHPDRVLKCQKCSKGCFGHLRKGEPVTCVHWQADEVAAFVR